MVTHEDEFIANSEITNGLRMIINPEIIAGLKKMSQTIFGRGDSTTNNYNQNSYSNDRQVVQKNINFNIETNIADKTDANMLVNKGVRDLSRKV